MRLRLCRAARLEELQQVRKELRVLLERVGAPEDAIVAVLLCCSEACGNAVRHPMQSSRAAFEVEADANREEISIIVRDLGRGRAAKAEGDPGGMGLMLMRALMDDVRLQRLRNGTLVRMHRKLAVQER
jgi:anti-sigma regulatory factor (Ser/Thr protein kinase)